MPNVNEFLRQAQIMQRKISKVQEELESKSFEASSGGGMVKVVINGKHQLTNLKIDPAVMEQSDLEMLQDLIVAAVNEASRIAQESIEREVNALSGGIKLPGFF